LNTKREALPGFDVDQALFVRAALQACEAKAMTAWSIQPAEGENAVRLAIAAAVLHGALLTVALAWLR
jgi:uncharacterized protein YcnI